LAYLGNGEYAKATEELRIVIAANPRNPVAYLSLGRVLFATDKNDQAITAYKKALEIFPDYGDAHYYLGLAYLKAKKIDDARTEFKETVRLVPDFESGRSSQQYLDLLK
jgi:tetratricopeptide (TPR) repeat protein